MSTYLEQIRRVLTTNPIGIPELMDRMNVPTSKQTYVIGALKSGIEKGIIEHIKHPNEKRLYLGHTYRLIEW